MLKINIPDYKLLEIEHLVLDYNGTLAQDGQIIEGVEKKLRKLSTQIEVHILTADTFGTVKSQFTENFINIEIIEKDKEGIDYKSEFIKSLGQEKVISIGNGNNDAQMLKSAALGIAIIGNEGAAVNALMNADIAIKSIKDALDILINKRRLIATLRR